MMNYTLTTILITLIQLRTNLGIPLNKRVILYAPTFRADGGFDFKLDLDKLQEKLSDGYVLLVRLHYFVAHSNSFSTTILDSYTTLVTTTTLTIYT
ncbi:hypothetical protein AKUH4B406M_09130 [Apilactobacillus kunkeei]|nr:hypothetical protein AKUH4B406M_09130 [Apilactobacillus kunkeei]